MWTLCCCCYRCFIYYFLFLLSYYCYVFLYYYYYKTILNLSNKTVITFLTALTATILILYKIKPSLFISDNFHKLVDIVIQVLEKVFAMLETVKKILNIIFYTGESRWL